MKFFFTVWTDKATGAYRRFSFTNEEPMSQRRNVARDHSAIVLTIGNADHQAEAQEMLADVLAHALMLLTPEQREELDRETGRRIETR